MNPGGIISTVIGESISSCNGAGTSGRGFFLSEIFEFYVVWKGTIVCYASASPKLVITQAGERRRNYRQTLSIDINRRNNFRRYGVLYIKGMGEEGFVAAQVCNFINTFNGLTSIFRTCLCFRP